MRPGGDHWNVADSIVSSATSRRAKQSSGAASTGGWLWANALVRRGVDRVRSGRFLCRPSDRQPRCRADDRLRGEAITPTDAGARALAVECDRPDAAAVAAGPRGCSGAIDDARRLQSGVERDLQLTLSRSRNSSQSESATTRRAGRECISPDGPPRPISGRSQVGDCERRDHERRAVRPDCRS